MKKKMCNMNDGAMNVLSIINSVKIINGGML